MENDATFETTPVAASAGAGLREARERLGLRLPDVAERLRIRLDYLTAIEQGTLAPIPGHAYRVGFVRSYARLLGLDEDEILRRFREQGALGEAKPAEMKLPAPLPDHAVPKSVYIVAGVVVILLAYGLLYQRYDTLRHLADTVPPVPAELAPLVPPPAPAPAPVPAARAPAPVPTPPAPASSPSLAAPAAPARPAASLAITVTGDAWVEVREASGNILYSKLLHAGDSWPVPQEAGLTLTTGNAGTTEIVTNGKAGAPIGAAAEVLHDYQLTPPAPGAAPPPAAAKPAVTPTPAAAPAPSKETP